MDQFDLELTPLELTPVCICAENTVYFFVQSLDEPQRVFVADYEFWQDAVGLL